MYEIKAVVRSERVEQIVHALHADIPDGPGITVSIVRGIGRERTATRANTARYAEVPMAKLEIVVADDILDRVISTIRGVGNTGRAGDGKIFVSRVDRAINIRDAAEGADVL